MSLLTSHFLLLTSYFRSVPLSLCLASVWGRSSAAAVGRLSRIAEDCPERGAQTMSDLADRLSALEQRVTELRDFL